MAGLLSEIFSYGDGLKRKINGLLADPIETIKLGATRIAEDQKDLINLNDNAYPLPGYRTVLNTPEQISGFQAEAARKATEMGMAAMAAPRMSAAEAKAAGYWHPIGDGKKLPVPVSEMKADRTDAGVLLPWKPASPEQMQGGAIMRLHGDRSIAGQNLNGIGDTKFIDPVYLGGGYDFMRTPGTSGIWASDVGAAKGLQNKIDEAAKLGDGNVFGVYSSMGANSMNYNTMMADALLEQIKAGKLTKKAIKSFDKQLQEIRPEWRGLLAPESRDALEKNGALRHAFVDRMQLDEFQNAGFPNIAYTRWAITDPKLLNEPMYSNGLAIGKMRPGANTIQNPSNPHKTYNTQVAGDYFGGFEKSVPLEVMYPDFIKQRRAIGAPESGDIRSFQLGGPIQPANQEWLDGVMNYLEGRASP